MELQDLQKRYQEAVVVKETLNSEGWKIIERELDVIYAENLAKLIEGENPDARGVLRGIQILRNRLGYIISRGKAALEEINKAQKEG